MAPRDFLDCCIVGGGPAGLMLGLLLARAGRSVTVLEKHADFLRDFRGDTIHPSTMEVMHELGLLERFTQLPHQKIFQLYGQFGNSRIPLADFSHLPVHAPFIALMPQWDFLDFLADEARRYPGFELQMQAEATNLLEENGQVKGVTVRTPQGPRELHAALTIAADGRHSHLRGRAGLKVQDLGAPMDVLWFRLSRQPDDPAETMGRFEPGRIIVMLNRGTYWQCAFVIPKGDIEAIRAAGLSAFRTNLATLLPLPADRALDIRSWDDIKLLTVSVDRLESWCKPGLLCIGDAAHAMSPIGGVGINLAVQDAVAAANILARPLANGPVGLEDLRRVQKRREWPTRVTQRLQLLVQNNVIAPALKARQMTQPPLFVRALARWPLLRRLPARVIGMGIRPEHVAPEIRSRPSRHPAVKDEIFTQKE
jgi:2-polyprenyl-6-methoxyphenol hydroxylase-like FAD-dependent oxidoreductase